MMLSLGFTIILTFTFFSIHLYINYCLTGEIFQKRKSFAEISEIKIRINKKTPLEIASFITNYIYVYFFFVSFMLISWEELGNIFPFYLAFFIVCIFAMIHIFLIVFFVLLKKLDDLSRKKNHNNS